MGEAKRKQQIAGRCYLCGGTGLTKQHLWPDWASAYLKSPAHNTYHRTLNRTRPVDFGGGRVGVQIRETAEREKQGQPNQIKYRQFCASCNND